MIYFTGTRSNHKYKFTPNVAPSSYFIYLCFHRFIWTESLYPGVYTSFKSLFRLSCTE